MELIRGTGSDLVHRSLLNIEIKFVYIGIRLQDGIRLWWSVIGRYAKAGMNELND